MITFLRWAALALLLIFYGCVTTKQPDRIKKIETRLNTIEARINELETDLTLLQNSPAEPASLLEDRE
jgi:hypothetical protein